MMQRFSRISLLILASALVPAMAPTAARAQTNSEMADHLDRLERDVMVLQRQVARGQAAGQLPPAVDDMDQGPAAANMEVRISNLEDQIRQLRGQIEQNQFQTRKVSDDFERYRKDTDYRLNQLSQGAQPKQPVPANADGSSSGGAAVDTSSESQATNEDGTPAETSAGSGTLKPPQTVEALDTPHDLYQHSFRLLNQTRYDEAASGFQSFIQKYPKDPLIGNAFYWLGETYYIRRDYVKAADSFRQGFEALPGGPKAPDNLLKLAMSLDAMKQTKNACVVLGQIQVKFKDTAKGIVQKADAERTRMGCQ